MAQKLLSTKFMKTNMEFLVFQLIFLVFNMFYYKILSFMKTWIYSFAINVPVN